MDDTYDYSKEDTIWSMLREFYNRKMMSFVILLWILAVIFIVGSIYCGIRFFRAAEIKYMIMYAAIFICCTLSIGFLKVLAWVMLQRHSIKREIKRLELRIAELNETVKNK